MRLLLINKNPVVSRMMQMSVPKAGFEIEECDNVYALPSGHYEVVVIDDEMYDENFLHDIKQHVTYQQLGLITATKAYASEEFDFILSKPFLPTDLIEILRKVRGSLEKRGIRSQTTVQKNAEPFDEFLRQPLEKDLVKNESVDSIVEIEDLVEEPPIVEKITEKGDVLDKSEIAAVSQLLHETETDTSSSALDDLLDINIESIEEKNLFEEDIEQRRVRPLSLMEDEKKEDMVRRPEPINLLDEEPLVQKGEERRETPKQPKQSLSFPQESIVNAMEAPSEQEKELKEKIGTATQQERELHQLQEEFTKKEERDQKLQQQRENVQAQMKGMIERMDVQTIRDVLNGMRIDITIQISYPEK